MHRLLYIIIILMAYIPSLKAEKEMPIIAYWGVPDTMSNESRFREFSECGFTVSIYPYWQLETLVKACRKANKYGVKIIGRCPEMKNNPTAIANILSKEQGFMGYFIQDEPNVPEIRQRQKEIKRLQHVDSAHIFYINLLPFTQADWVEPSVKVKTYPEYLRAASSTSCNQISFDFYPITTAGVHPSWYHNLEMVRSESLASGKPFWGFALSVPHNVPNVPDTYYPTPNMAMLRLQIYSNLAYGAQAIQYFTYWTPTPTKDIIFHDAPIGLDGKKTKTYALVQQMNKELREVSRLFYGAKVLSVHHLGGKLPQGTTRQKRMPLNLKTLKVISSKGAVISQFEKNGHRYLAIVNKDHEKSIKILIATRNDIPRHITKTLQEEPMDTSYNISPGDILIFRLK